MLAIRTTITLVIKMYPIHSNDFGTDTPNREKDPDLLSAK